MAAPCDLLTIDCGNSTIRCRRHRDGATFVTASDAPDVAALRAFASERCQRAVVVSVVASSLLAVRDALAPTAVALDVVGEDLLCPLPLAYDTPETLGADRWLGALAAHRRCGAAITVDCGTATTCNLVDADGTFRGGAIAPGLAALVAGLAEKAPALPVADLDATVALPAPSTQQSVDAGVLVGWAGLVERLVAELRVVAGAQVPVVVTGGNAPRLIPLVRIELEHAPDLLHDGMRALAGVDA